jgi:RNA polymerase sigma factor (sigma-70 family)
MCCTAAKSKTPPHDEHCEAWLRGIARNLIREHWRRVKRDRCHMPIENAVLSRQLAEDMESRPLPPDVLARAERVDQLLLAVTSLPTAEQHLLFAFYFEGRSQADIANELGATVKSVESKLYRARNNLRATLKNPERTHES